MRSSLKEDKTKKEYTSSVWTEDEDDDDNEMVLWMCEEHHGSSLSSASLATNADVVRSKENSHLEVVLMVAPVATILR